MPSTNPDAIHSKPEPLSLPLQRNPALAKQHVDRMDRNLVESLGGRQKVLEMMKNRSAAGLGGADGGAAQAAAMAAMMGGGLPGLGGGAMPGGGMPSMGEMMKMMSAMGGGGGGGMPNMADMMKMMGSGGAGGGGGMPDMSEVMKMMGGGGGGAPKGGDRNRRR